MADNLTDSLILIVDDDKSSRRLVQAQLHIAGFRNLLFAVNGLEALELVNTHTPDLVLLDVMMPGMTGYTVTRRFREKFPNQHIPIILISALQSPEDRTKGIEAGANDFLSRPVDGGELAARITSQLMLKQARDALMAERQRLAILYDVSRALTAELDFNALMQQILTLTRALTGAEKATLVLLDEQGEFQQKIQSRHGGQPRSVARIDPAILNRGLLGWVIQKRQSALIPELLVDDRWMSLPDEVPARSAVATPIVWGDQLIGGLLLQAPLPDAFNDQHLDLLTAICNQAAVAIQNARLYEETRRQRARAEALLSQTGDAVVVADERTIVTSINPAARRLLELDDSAIGRPLGNVFSLHLADLLMRGAERGTAVSGEYDFHRRSGEQYSFNVSISPVTGVGFMLVWQDITHVKEGERARLEMERAETQRIRETFARYMSEALVERVLSDPNILSRRERHEAVVLFADLRGFTRLTIEHSADSVLALLNDVFTRLMDIAYRNEGVIFDVAGDELMIAFNVPYEQPDAAQRALITAIDMQREFATLRDKWAQQGMKMGIGIGISRGSVVLGHVGGRSRMNYAMVGQAVNIAHRLVDTAADGQIVVTPDLLANGLPDDIGIQVRETRPLFIPGVEQTLPALLIELNASHPSQAEGKRAS